MTRAASRAPAARRAEWVTRATGLHRHAGRRAGTVDATTASDPAAVFAVLRSASPAAVDVFVHLLTRGPTARIDVARATGLSQAAVTKAVAPLVAAGLVRGGGAPAPGGPPGRPASPVRVDPEAVLAIGVKVNPDEVIGVVTDLQSGIVHSARQDVDDPTPERVTEAVALVVSRLEELLGDRSDRVAAVCAAVSGDVDTASGTVRESALLGWTDVPLGALLTEALGRDVLIENDVRALTIAEHWFGVGVGTGSFAIVTIGSGIGCGLHVNGQVVEGAFGVAGEIGHLPLTSQEHVCTCGRRGCVEAVASSSAIVRQISSARGAEVTMAEAVTLAHAGDAAAAAVFDLAGTVIGTAIATVANLTGPEIVLITGEGVSDYELFDDRLRAAFAAHAFGAAGECRIVLRPHSFDDWARGAAAAALRAVVLQRMVGGSAASHLLRAQPQE
ncbi:ROK family transcriptional regulator [Herbiconiux daphne]|uniref:ROK family transcriptional regulator n=1 Tax=Herbiconiux daphne TaxID=2970914 RepID=A0ABT2H5T0_9MICO|nr:ROK family transcriptional regulator [Herbiconiux daphne]MCS5735282.1 ROK family transcriptional regulator [Herbiconiux daphne]